MGVGMIVGGESEGAGGPWKLSDSAAGCRGGVERRDLKGGGRV